MITERAMLAAVHISIWTAVKHDRRVSRDVADQHGAHQGAGRYNKQLLRGADKLDELRTLAGQIRQYFYKITLPWSDEGFRLLPANFYFDLMARMREFEAGFDQGVESFLRVYPQYIEQVRPELNGLFREEDYPKAEKLRRKFGVKLEVLPIPTGNDFRVQMSAEEQARVAREIDSNVRQSLVRGAEDLWSRLRDVVSHMVDRLNEPESRFHATLVTNIFDLVELLPKLNVTGDPELNRFAEEARQKLGAGVPFPQRLGAPAEYAQLACHIVENRMINGETIRLDGALRMPPRPLLPRLPKKWNPPLRRSASLISSAKAMCAPPWRKAGRSSSDPGPSSPPARASSPLRARSWSGPSARPPEECPCNPTLIRWPRKSRATSRRSTS